MNEINVKIRKLHADAVVPSYATAGSAGFDLVACEDVIIASGETMKVPLGIAVELPPGYEMQIRPRLGVTLKTKLRVANSPGTVDADFRGELAVLIDNVALPDYTAWFSNTDGYVVAPETRGYLLTLDSDVDAIHYNGPDDTTVPLEFGWHREHNTYIIRKGDRIAQGVIQAVPRASFSVVDSLSDTDRGAGGFGSTGINV